MIVEMAGINSVRPDYYIGSWPGINADYFYNSVL